MAMTFTENAGGQAAGPDGPIPDEPMVRFIRERAWRIAMQARRCPDTCRVSRAWLNRARKWAKQHAAVELGREIAQAEQGIL